MSKFQRREYQKLMTSFMLQHHRCNIWASMGRREDWQRTVGIKPTVPKRAA